MQTLCDNIINKNDPNIGAFIEALKELFNLFKWGIYKELLKWNEEKEEEQVLYELRSTSK